MEKIKICAIIAIILAFSFIFVSIIPGLVQINLQKAYDAGYKDSPTFIDCTLPSINRTMEFVYSTESIRFENFDGEQVKEMYEIDYDHLSWRELCDRLKLTGFYKKIDSKEAYNLMLEIFKVDSNLSEVPEVIENIFKESIEDIESEENYLALFDDSRTKYLEASESGGKK